MCVLSIAIPIFNMDWCLEKNLSVYLDHRFQKKIEIICLNNASTDASKAIIEKYCKLQPEIFSLINRCDRGYGSSINTAISSARGRYFRIVDGDDWVDTEELYRQVSALEDCDADIVLTDYKTINLQTGKEMCVTASDSTIQFGKKYSAFELPLRTLPGMACTTYQTALLRDTGFYMQNGIRYTDEEYVILPYLGAKSVCYLPFNVYRYQIAISTQSTAPQNRAQYQKDREQVLRRLIRDIQVKEQVDPENNALAYCKYRINKGIGDHFTTLLMYVRPRSDGRKLAKEWKRYIQKKAPEAWEEVKSKYIALCLLNRAHLSLACYEAGKKMVLRIRSIKDIYGCLRRRNRCLTI